MNAISCSFLFALMVGVLSTETRKTSESNFGEAWRWRALECWKKEDSVPCSSDSDCLWPCRWRWVNSKFPIKCAGEPNSKYCMMKVADFVPSWLLDRKDGEACCYKPLEQKPSSH